MAGGGRGKGPLVAIVAVVLVLLLGGGIGTWALLRGGGPGPDDDPTSPPASQASSDDGPTEDEPPADPDEPLASCPAGDEPALAAPVGGRLLGAGLSFAVQPGFVATAPDVVEGYSWLFGLNAVHREDYLVDGHYFFSTAVLGYVQREDGYTGLEQTARSMVVCSEDSGMMGGGVTYGEPTVAPLRVDGHEAVRLTYRAQLAEEDFPFTAYDETVVVVDTGDEATYAVFIVGHPTTPPEKAKLTAAAIASLQVD